MTIVRFTDKEFLMKKFTNYITRQAQRPLIDLTHDFIVVGGFFLCVYFGFIQ